MDDFEKGEGLGVFEDGEEGFKQTFEFGVCEECGNEEHGSEGDDGPQSEGDGIVSQKVLLFGGL